MGGTMTKKESSSGQTDKLKAKFVSHTDEFLDLYKQLEQLLKLKYGNDSQRYESVVARYENSRESGDLKDEIMAIREIRNLLQHTPKVNNRYIVEPSIDVMNALRAVIDQVEHPRLAVDFGVWERNIYKATLNSGLLKVLRVMKDRGFSHVPVIENNRLYGVLSAYTVFEFVTEQGMQILTEDTKIRDVQSYLPINRHKNEYYLFMSRKATFIEADEAFDKRDSKHRRLVSIFITENGKPDEPILSMLTPWSVVGK